MSKIEQERQRVRKQFVTKIIEGKLTKEEKRNFVRKLLEIDEKMYGVKQIS